MQWYLTVLKKYADFSGRARRREYWMFFLFNGIIGLVLTLLSQVAGIFGVLQAIYGLAILIPSLAVGVRRLHDIGKSGLFLLFAIIPIADIILLVYLCSDSKPESNEFGPCPK